MPFGEMTITLDDIFCLTGFSIAGKTVVSMREDRMMASEELSKVLGVSVREAKKGLQGARGGIVKLNWLKKKFMPLMKSEDKEELQVYTRAYLLYMFGSALFPDKTGNRVPTAWLEFLDDLDNLDSYAWGAAILAYTYIQLGDASVSSCRQMTGFTDLLEAWIYEYFPRMVRPPPNSDYRPELPLACRWGRPGPSGPTIERIVALRERIDRMTADEVKFFASLRN